MSNQIQKQTFQFLKNLKTNNNREWFADNKVDYELAKENITGFINHLIENLAETDPEILKIEGKKAMFRIYRDVRFSLDKTPYKTHFGASLGMGKYNRTSGYYLHLEPGNSFVAGGVYLPEKENLKKIRKSISNNPKEFLEIVNDENFKQTFTELSTEDKLKRIPQGFDKEDKMEDFLKLKSFVVRFPIKDQDFMKAESIEKIAAILNLMKPLNEFIEMSIKE
ncbi:DUF2461 domain-containing protein [Frigoriflavimonas asaccharolytica]|uniref:Uncharacterized protein (TIGR02453 family) n=1 Tax=Frigoriflavimonas asaccharolytica TaxID=2735899 RepID=A0A8J8G727_9FLAO|nr:DUF2461 domain-containing protein [Frigoriflavimonas asaccharolytica]NRS92363.1 uncharacterized protein (TIGR02453 family) [Frigoriflavimonas asaccharolytica]